jgi:hypothetical protein
MPRSSRDYLIAAGAAAEAARVFRRGFVARISGRVASIALRRGMRSGSRGWLYVAAGAQGLRMVQRMIAPKPETFRLNLKPGDAIEIREIRRSK